MSMRRTISPYHDSQFTETAATCGPPKSPTMVSDDSGYVSATAKDTRDTRAGLDDDFRRPDDPAALSGIPTPEGETEAPEPHFQRPPPTATQRTFEGLTIFNPNQPQVERYNAILDYIVQPLNESLQKRGKLLASLKPKTKGVTAIRLVVMGQCQENAKPYMVVFCTPELHGKVEETMAKPTYQEILRVDGQPNLSFSYKVISRGARLRYSLEQFRVDIPAVHDHCDRTDCGVPIRLYKVDDIPGRYRRATLGGVLRVTTNGLVKFHGMTAGHSIDDWDDAKDGAEDGLAIEPRSWTSPWEFVRAKKYTDVSTGHSQFGRDQRDQYFDWALFPMDDWQPNFTEEMNGSYSIISDVYTTLPSRTIALLADRPVIIMTSRGSIEGYVQPGLTKIAIDPGKEVVDAYLISLHDPGGKSYDACLPTYLPQ